MSTAGKDDVARRIKLYIDMVKEVLKQLKGSERELPEKVRKLIDLASDYLEDSKYYFGAGDYVTSLSCISYAEGLLDALARLGYINVEWYRKKPAKVLVGGTFDIVHPGHIEFLKEAAKRGLVYVVVARDQNVKKIKGRSPIMNEKDRLAVVSAIKYVYKAFLGDESDFLKPIEVIRPDIIFLGPDQFMDEEYLSMELAKRGLKVKVERMSKRVGEGQYSTTKIIRKILRDRSS